MKALSPEETAKVYRDSMEAGWIAAERLVREKLLRERRYLP